MRLVDEKSFFFNSDMSLLRRLFTRSKPSTVAPVDAGKQQSPKPKVTAPPPPFTSEKTSTSLAASFKGKDESVTTLEGKNTTQNSMCISS